MLKHLTQTSHGNYHSYPFNTASFYFLILEVTSEPESMEISRDNPNDKVDPDAIELDVVPSENNHKNNTNHTEDSKEDEVRQKAVCLCKTGTLNYTYPVY